MVGGIRTPDALCRMQLSDPVPSRTMRFPLAAICDAAANGFVTSVVAWKVTVASCPLDEKLVRISPTFVSFWPPAALYLVPVSDVATVL